jgi:toxin HigB-1
MIITFVDKRTADLFVKGTARCFPTDVAHRAVRKLEYVHLAIRLDDLRTPPGNRPHPLRGVRDGQHPIANNHQWRIFLRLTDGDAIDVEVYDYH